MRNDHAHAVRTQDAHAGRRRQIDDSRLPLRAVLVQFGKAGRDDYATADAGLGRFIQVLLQRAARHCEDRHIRRRWQRADARIRFAAEYLRLMPADRKKIAGKTVLHQEARDAPAELRDVVGCAKHRDRARMQNLIYCQPRCRAFAGDVRRVQDRRLCHLRTNH